MNYNNLRKEYLKQSVMTASPAELIVMLFESCIKNLKLAEICLNERRGIENQRALPKAQKLLWSSLTAWIQALKSPIAFLRFTNFCCIQYVK